MVFVQHESLSGYLELGSAAWQLAAGLDVKATDIKIRKTTPDAFLCTDLEAVLQNQGVKNLVICGMHTEFCVDTTTRRALALGYPVTAFVTLEIAQTESYTGIDGINQQDRALQESMGRIVDRSREHLGPADKAIIQARKLLRDDEYAGARSKLTAEVASAAAAPGLPGHSSRASSAVAR